MDGDEAVKLKQQWLGEISQNIMAGILMGLALLPVAIAFSFIVHISPTIGLMVD